MLVAIVSGSISAVGMVTNEGEVLLNYVSPDTRFGGVSRALLRALEDRSRERGTTLCKLGSTETARRFYRSNGYVESGGATEKFGTRASYRMTKSLD